MELSLQVFHIVDLVLVEQLLHRHALLLELVDKGMGRDDCLHVGHVTAVVHRLGRIRVVQVVHRLALDEARHIHDDARAGRRNKHAHMFFALSELVDYGAERECRRREGICREVVSIGAVHRGAATHMLHCTNPGRGHRTQLADVSRPGRNGKFLDGAFYHHRAGIERQLLAESDRDNASAAMHHVLEAGIGHGVATAPQTLHVERHKLEVRHILDGGRVIQAEAVHIASRGHHVLGEHHHGFTAQQGLAGLLHRGSRIRDVEVDGLHLRKQKLDVPLFKRPARNYEAHGARARHLDNRPVDVRDVVTHQEHRTFPRDILHARHKEFVMHRQYRTKQLAQQGLRHGPEGPDGPHKANDAEDEEQVHPFETEIAEGDNRKDVENKDAQVLHHVGQREYVARRPRFGVVKERCEHRERIDTATEAEQGESDGVVGARNKRNDKDEDGSTRGPHRDKAHLDKVTRHPLGKDEARNKADGGTENGVVHQEVLIEQRTGAELVLDNEHHEENHDPEHRLANKRLAQRPVLPGLHHLAASIAERPVLLPGEAEIFVVGADGRQPERKEEPEQLQAAQRIEHRPHQVFLDRESEGRTREHEREERDNH